jgi:hypothetical protein
MGYLKAASNNSVSLFIARENMSQFERICLKLHSSYPAEQQFELRTLN